MGHPFTARERRKLIVDGTPELGSRRNLIERGENALPEAAEKAGDVAVGLEIGDGPNVVRQLSNLVGQ
ncbi:MAG: hypothetical protein WA869_19440, partial [Alloacidobacterium sp.]